MQNKFLVARLRRPINAYLLKCIPTSEEIRAGWNMDAPTDAHRVKFVYSCFMSEYGWALENMNTVAAFDEWLSGLPSSFNVEFMYADIINKAYETGMLKKTGYKPLDDYEEEKMCKNWFKEIAYKFLQLHAYIVKCKDNI